MLLIFTPLEPRAHLYLKTPKSRFKNQYTLVIVPEIEKFKLRIFQLNLIINSYLNFNAVTNRG